MSRGLLFVLSLAIAGRVAAAEGLKERLAKIEAILEEQRQKLHIPGMSFAIVVDDQVVYLKAFGRRDIERNLPATVDTVFPIGSCTKAFTSMAAGISQDEGTLTLDDSPHKLLPYFKMADPEANALVTVRDMLSHRTGLKGYADLAAEPAVLTREEYVRAATSAKPVAKLRAEFQYSNAMYTAVGEIVAKANRMTWERVIETKIFAPLGMTSSMATAAEIIRKDDHAVGYLYRDDASTWRPVQPPASLKALAPAGSLASSARDMTRWLRFLINGGTIDGKRVVAEATLRDLTTVHTQARPSFGYALGWAIYDWNGHKVVEHNGGSQGISALMSFMPDRRAGFVLLANTSPTFMTGIGNAGKLLWPLIVGEEAAAPAAPPAAAEPAPPAPAAGPPLPAVDDVLARIVQAAGGERNLARHRSVEIHALKSYDNQGVRADLTIRAKAPAMRVEEEAWTAVGKRIGRVRTYFDGARGGQETSFGQESTYKGDEIERARREASLHPLLELKRLYKDVSVQKRVGDDDTIVLRLTPEHGSPVSLYVSVRTSLIVQREVEGESVEYADYRNVDGEVVPFRSTIRDALGETSVQVKDVRFNVAVPDVAFAPGK